MSARSNHYEALGVSPAADSDEIDRAFAWQRSALRPHAFGGLAEVCMAYQTLRDPVRRKAYDASIGIKAEPHPQNLMKGWSHPALGRGPADSSAPRPPIRPEAPDDIPSFLARPAHKPEPHVGRDDPPPPVWEKRVEVDLRPTDWKRVGIALGGVIGAACLLGGLAGWWSAGAIGETPPAAEEWEPPAIPPAKPLAASDGSAFTAMPAPAARVERPGPSIAAPRRSERMSIVAKPSEADRPSLDSLAESLPEPAESEPTAAEAPAAATAAAAMPLPNRVVARTIERIGYSCGQVVSTVPADGAAGVYTVSCSSGQSYRASPINGRYRFKRLGSR